MLMPKCSAVGEVNGDRWEFWRSRKAETKEAEASAAGKALGFGSEQSRVDTTAAAL